MNRKRLISVVLVILLALMTGVLTTPVAAQGVSFSEAATANLPWDAAPSPDGATIYYTAIGKDGAPSVFSVPAAGGDPVVLAAGEPLAMPLGIDVSNDGKTLYVTDPWMAGAAGNAIFAIPSDGSSAPTLVNGTRGKQPVGITVMGDGLLSIQARSSFVLVLLLPPIKRRTRDVEFPTGLCDIDVFCIFKDCELES